MITLTTPPFVNSVLGGTTTVSYDKFVLSSIVHDPVTMVTNARIKMTSTAEPTMQAVYGDLKIDTTTATLTIEVSKLDFYRQITLTGPQNTSAQGFIVSAQDSLESGLLSIGVVDGIQSQGA